MSDAGERGSSSGAPRPSGSTGPRPSDDVQAVRSALRADLVAAMRSRQPDAVAALRTALAAIDNAEAVEVPDGASGAADGPVAGAHIGVGSTEAERRVLSSGQVRALLRAEVEERDADADRYDAHGQHGAAERLRRQADALRPHVDG